MVIGFALVLGGCFLATGRRARGRPRALSSAILARWCVDGDGRRTHPAVAFLGWTVLLRLVRLLASLLSWRCVMRLFAARFGRFTPCACDRDAECSNARRVPAAGACELPVPQRAQPQDVPRVDWTVCGGARRRRRTRPRRRAFRPQRAPPLSSPAHRRRGLCWTDDPSTAAPPPENAASEAGNGTADHPLERAAQRPLPLRRGRALRAAPQVRAKCASFIRRQVSVFFLRDRERGVFAGEVLLQLLTQSAPRGRAVSPAPMG